MEGIKILRRKNLFDDFEEKNRLLKRYAGFREVDPLKFFESVLRYRNKRPIVVDEELNTAYWFYFSDPEELLVHLLKGKGRYTHYVEFYHWCRIPKTTLMRKARILLMGKKGGPKFPTCALYVGRWVGEGFKHYSYHIENQAHLSTLVLFDPT